jgi:uncharacterized protein (TIRG00374 family)
MDKKKIYQSILFFIVGVGLFWLVFRGTDLHQLKNELYRINWFWVGVSVLLNLLSQMVRALRWKTLFTPLKYSPKVSNLFYALLLLAFTNQIIPRGGEVARLGVVNKYEKIPFTKLLGIAMVERLTDLIILLTIFLVLLVWQFPLIQQIIELPQINLKDFSILQTVLIISAVVVTLIVAFYVIKKTGLIKRFNAKLKKIKKDLHEGFTSIYHIENKLIYFLQSVLIYVLWLLMLYVLFFAYPPTEQVSFKAAAFTFGLATMAFLLPIQAGMGAWHFLVIQSLILFGVDSEAGKVFALLAHSATNHIYLITGVIAFGLLPLTNQKAKRSKKTQE